MRTLKALALLCCAVGAAGLLIHASGRRGATSEPCPACGGETHQPWSQQPHRECLRCGLRYDPAQVIEGARFDRPDAK